MSADFIVKVCGVTSVEDARTAVDAGANAIGLNFHPPSPRYITPSHAKEIATALPRHILRVGIFVCHSAEEMTAIAALVPLDVLQLYNSTVVPHAAPYQIWRAVQIRNGAIPEDPGHADGYLPDAYLVDSESPGSGRAFDWTRLPSAWARPIIVAGGLDSSNVGEAIAALQPWGVDACSRLESAPGKKDPERVRAFVTAAHAALQQKSVTL